MLVDQYTVTAKYNRMKADLEDQIKILKEINVCFSKENQRLRNRTYRLNKQICDLRKQLVEEKPELVTVKKTCVNSKCVVS